MKKQLLPWQESCLKAWEANGFRGIANVTTGAGKTILAVAAIHRLMCVADRIHNLKIKIVVPKTFLMYQWHSVMMEELQIPRTAIGFFSGAYKSDPGKLVMLYVVNSARDVLARHITEDISRGNSVFLIADECHHYGASSNARIFGYRPHIPKEAPIYTLGLSATPWCTNYLEVLVPALGEEIYSFNFLAALRAEVINRFSLFNISISFSPEEWRIYDELSDQLGLALFKLREVYPGLSGKGTSSFFSLLEDIIRHSDPETADLAKAVLSLSMQRMELIYQAQYRIDCVVELVRRLPKGKKIIIFGERIETAVEIGRRLQVLYPNEVGIYHSQSPKDLNMFTLRQFKDRDIRILVSCKTLDEGLDIAETDVGIVVSSTGSRRQRIQRLGRVLRKKPGAERAYFYYLFVGGTNEEEDLLKEMLLPEFDRHVTRVHLQYDEEEGTFNNHQYRGWEADIVQDMTESGHSPEAVIEFMRNADRGLLSDHWLMPEALCRKKIDAACHIDERNYFIAMLMIIRARVGTRA